MWDVKGDEFYWRPPDFNKQCARAKALHELWSKAADEVLVRHPDPTAKVTISFTPPPYQNEQRIDGRFSMTNMRDSNDPDVRMNEQFHMRLAVREWPGKYNAQLWILGAWTQYMLHEVSELVHFKDKLPPPGKGVPDSNSLGYGFVRGGKFPDKSRVLNMHHAGRTITRHHWNDMETVQWGDADTMTRTMGLIVGKEYAKVLIEDAAKVAKQEMDEATERYLAAIEGRPVMTVTGVDKEKGVVTVAAKENPNGFELRTDTWETPEWVKLKIERQAEKLAKIEKLNADIAKMEDLLAKPRLLVRTPLLRASDEIEMRLKWKPDIYRWIKTYGE